MVVITRGAAPLSFLVGDGEELVGCTSQGVPTIVAHFAADESDLSELQNIRAQERALLALPEDDRNAAWMAMSPLLAGFSENEASFRALESLYTRGQVQFNGLSGVKDGGLFQAWSECYTNARAVRERRTLTVNLLIRAVKARIALYPERRVELASIASGSARCVLETLKQLEGANVHARMLDHDEHARTYCMQLAYEMGLPDQVQVLTGDVLRVARSPLKAYPIDVAEAVGIFDYLDDAFARFLIKQIRHLLSEGGFVLASNVMDNPEREFLHSVIGWRPMEYRTESEFVDLFLQAGFRVEDCLVHRIPTGVYCIVEATK